MLLRAFASGCSALTGVEAISNGVTAFRRPQARNAASTLHVDGRDRDRALPGRVDPGLEDRRAAERVGLGALGDRARRVPARARSSFGYYAVQATTAGVLALAANTAFQGFPRLAALLASDSFLPRQFSNLGDRLVYSNGILVLALAAGALIVGFHADVISLIHLYLLGVFTAFTLSQFGMVRHHWRRRASGRLARVAVYKIGLNATGGLLTGLVGAIVITTKFGEGAWMVVIAIPVLVLGFAVVGRHYADVRTRLRDPGGDYARRARAGRALRQRARRRDGRGAALRPRDRRRPLPGDPRRRCRRRQRHRPGLARISRRRAAAPGAAARAHRLGHGGALRAGDRARRRAR